MKTIRSLHRRTALAAAVAASALFLDRNNEQSQSAAECLARAAEALRAVARLGSLLPAISLWHLRTALRQEAVARGQIAEQRDPQPVPSPL